MPRAPTTTAATLQDDAVDWRYRWIWMPMLAVQAVLYTRVLYRFVSHAGHYREAPTQQFPLLHENHIGNLVSLKHQPPVVLVGIHLVMAWAWIAGVLVQKHLVRRMAAGGTGYLAARRIHAIVGLSLLILGFVGIAIAPIIALLAHGNPPMKWFLVAQVFTFFPPMTMVAITAFDHRRPIAQHRFWAEFAFVGPAVASVWTEAGIHVVGRYTSVGPNAAELWSSIVGGALGFMLVVVPAWFALRRTRSSA